jgi:hypothetical protein
MILMKPTPKVVARFYRRHEEGGVGQNTCAIQEQTAKCTNSLKQVICGLQM